MAPPYALRFCQAIDVAGNTLFSGMVASSSTSEHAPCNNSSPFDKVEISALFERFLDPASNATW
jgi:hypothetical protein